MELRIKVVGGGGIGMGNTCKSMADSYIDMYDKTHYNIVK